MYQDKGKTIETWNPLAGECRYQCYTVDDKCNCYVSVMKNKKNTDGDYVFPFMKAKYSGEYRLVEKEFKRKFKPDTTVFVCDCSDLFHPDVHPRFIRKILKYCENFPDTTFLFQTKNPYRFEEGIHLFPKKSIFGTTVQSNRNDLTPLAPYPFVRCLGLEFLKKDNPKLITFITIEPILEFDLKPLVEMIKHANPNWIWIGANSKGGNLPEPDEAQTKELLSELKQLNIKIKVKENLYRIINKSEIDKILK